MSRDVEAGTTPTTAEANINVDTITTTTDIENIDTSLLTTVDTATSAISTTPSSEELTIDTTLATSTSHPHTSPSHHDTHVRARTSRYDFVKVRIWLGDQSNPHYHVLSRYLVSRILMVTMIPPRAAIRISLDIKKYLVDTSLLDLSQDEFEQHLFSIMATYGYTDPYHSRYTMMTSFHTQRIPLLILLSGTCLIGKSLVATHLATRLNLTHVIHTTTMYDLACTMNELLPCGKIYHHTYDNEQHLITTYIQRTSIVKRALHIDLFKCWHEGKSMIVQGCELDPSLYYDVVKECRSQYHPIVVNCVLTLDEKDHCLLIQHAHHQYQRQHSTSPLSIASITSTCHILNQHLIQHAHDVNIPIISMQLTTLQSTVDTLHSMVLDRIRDAVQSLQS